MLWIWIWPLNPQLLLRWHHEKNILRCRCLLNNKLFADIHGATVPLTPAFQGCDDVHVSGWNIITSIRVHCCIAMEECSLKEVFHTGLSVITLYVFVSDVTQEQKLLVTTNRSTAKQTRQSYSPEHFDSCKTCSWNLLHTFKPRHTRLLRRLFVLKLWRRISAEWTSAGWMTKEKKKSCRYNQKQDDGQQTRYS